MNKFFVSDSLIQWIKQNTGIHILPDNYDQIALVLKEKAKNKKLSVEKYIFNLLTSQADTYELIDSIITPESYFLRYRQTMIFVIKNIIVELLKKSIKPTVLSIACARGEEPYSFAMLLMDAGIDPKNISITGIDISKACINTAISGIYTLYSLRRVPNDFLSRHFLPSNDSKFKIQQYIKESVIFKQMNVLNDALNLLNKGFYHVIFCHNLFIYFDEPTILKSLSIIDKLMNDDGWLFVDSAESMHPKTHFSRIQAGESFGFRKKGNLSAKENKKILTKESDKPAFKPQQKSDDLPELFIKAEKLYKEKFFDEALKLYEELANKIPKFRAVSFFKTAKIQADQGNLMQALEMAETALIEHQEKTGILLNNEELAEIHALIAFIMREKGLNDKAQYHFERLKALNPYHPALKTISII